MTRRILIFTVTFIIISSLFVFSAAGDETVIRFDNDDYESSPLWNSISNNKNESSEQAKTQEIKSESESQEQTQHYEPETQDTPSVWGALSGTKEAEPQFMRSGNVTGRT